MRSFLTTAAASGGLSRMGIFVARHRNARPIRVMAALCQKYLTWYGNVSYDLRTNGESFVLARLGNFRPRVLFDVGANVGDWSLEASHCCPLADIHSFEIAAPTFDRLVTNTKDLPRVHCRLAGLSDAEGSIRIRYYQALPALTTALAYPHSLPFSERDAAVITGDAYCEQNGVGHIDLLKIDVEGMEQQVLKGFERMFVRKGIDLVQFEYGRASIFNGFLLRDFYALFRTRGFVVGKVFPNYVDFREYEPADEDFGGPNYLACRADRVDYLRAFSSGR